MARFRDRSLGRTVFSDRHMRDDAARAIETALLVLEHKDHTPEQRSDIAAAIDAFRDRAWSLAVTLAFAATRERNRTFKGRRLAGVARSCDETKTSFAAARQHLDRVMATPIVNRQFEVVGWTLEMPQI